MGVSASAGLGAVLGILLSLPVIAIQGLGFVTGLVTVVIVYALARALRSQNEVLVLVLAGIVVGALAGAGISLMKILSIPTTSSLITFWLLGSLSGIKVSDVWGVAPLVVAGLVPLVLLRWRIGVLSLGDDEARALGVNVLFIEAIDHRGGDPRHGRRRFRVGRSRLGRPDDPPHGPPPGRAALRPRPAGRDTDGRRLPRAGRYARTLRRAHRNPARPAHRPDRRTDLRLAALARGRRVWS